MRDETDAMTVEHCEDLLVVPALVAELDDLLEVAGQSREEGVEPPTPGEGSAAIGRAGAELVRSGRASAMKRSTSASQSSSFFMWVMKRLTFTA